MLDRDEPFHAFHRLYVGFQEFLQAEQVEGLLGLPALYGQLPPIIGITHLDQTQIAASTERLRGLLAEWVTD
jgi:hypothetical protein